MYLCTYNLDDLFTRLDIPFSTYNTEQGGFIYIHLDTE